LIKISWAYLKLSQLNTGLPIFFLSVFIVEKNVPGLAALPINCFVEKLAIGYLQDSLAWFY
jgi:hypothetical protein